MDYKPATVGQVKQIIAKVVAAIPAESFSFHEAERLLRDGQLSHDISVMLRRHSHNDPVMVRVPESAFEVLLDLNCKFQIRDKYLTPRRVAFWRGEPAPMLLAIVGSPKRSETAPKEVFLEVLNFESGKTCQEIALQLSSMGYRSADFIEASGFLQAKGKTFRNPGRSEGCHRFSVILPTAAQVEFYRNGECTQSSVWYVTASEANFPSSKCTGPAHVLAAKL